MSIKLKINSAETITFDLSAKDILTPYSGAPVTAVSKLGALNTQAQLCTTSQCYNCNEIQCSNVNCNQIHCNQVQCNQTQCNQVKCSNCTTVQCSTVGNCPGDCSTACADSRDD